MGEKMSGGKPARTADWAAIRRDYETCRDPLRKVAERGGVPRSTVHDRCKCEGWQRQSGVDWRKVRAEYEDGEFSVADIGERHGVSQYSIYRRKRNEGWEARCAAYPKAFGAGGAVNAGERLKGLVARELSSIEARLGLGGKKLDAGEPLRALHTLASAVQKILDIERKEKAADDAGSAGRLAIDDASRLALAERLETLARHWENDGDPGGARGDRAGGDRTGLAGAVGEG